MRSLSDCPGELDVVVVHLPFSLVIGCDIQKIKICLRIKFRGPGPLYESEIGDRVWVSHLDLSLVVLYSPPPTLREACAYENG